MEWHTPIGTGADVMDVGPLAGDLDPESGPKYVPDAVRSGIGLCVSGGGYRATLFHMGALRRLNELGVLARPDFRSVSSVSGGSITAAGLAAFLAGRTSGAVGSIPEAEWNAGFVAPVRAITRRNIRTPAVLKRLLPWNWLRTSTGVEALAAAYERHLTPLKLVQVPAAPGFVFCATDMAYGVNWVFQRSRVGDYQVGYKKPPDGSFPLARAVAASSCFPPVFNPLPAAIPPGDLKGGHEPDTPHRRECVEDLRLTDGGNYDNMGLEPVWKTHATVLVSDAGGLFATSPDQGLFWRVSRYQQIQERQSRALRKRWLMSNFILKAISGTYWGIGSGRESYDAPEGYTEDLAKKVIAEVRTDLDAFSDAEAAVLENHGYLLADAALRKHVSSLLPASPPPLKVPHPDWMDEARVARELAESGQRKLFGRW